MQKEQGQPGSGVASSRTEHERRIGEKLRRELGPLVCGLLNDTNVYEIMLNPDGRIWVDRFGEPMKAVGTMPAAQAENLIGTVASTQKTQVTAATAKQSALIAAVVAGAAALIALAAVVVVLVK